MNKFTGQVDAGYLKQAAVAFAPIKQASYGKMKLSAGHAVLDVGCGPGVDAIELGKIVTPSGRVVGVDHDEKMIEAALVQIRRLEMDDFVTFEKADAVGLPFESNEFDGCRSERVFMHLPRPDRALEEMIRVVKPGGRIVVVETDWPSLSVNCAYPDIERTLSDYRNHRVLTSGYAGRSLYGLFRAKKMSDIDIEVLPLFTTDLNLFYALSVQETVENQALAEGAIGKRELDDWRFDLKSKMDDDAFFASVNMIMISGGKTVQTE
ncbi:MAG: methyltransferase domain-containing protein [Gammaproteobacteria bacterium]